MHAATAPLCADIASEGEFQGRETERGERGGEKSTVIKAFGLNESEKHSECRYYTQLVCVSRIRCNLNYYY